MLCAEMDKAMQSVPASSVLRINGEMELIYCCGLELSGHRESAASIESTAI
jgi:hypothetical protein